MTEQPLSATLIFRPGVCSHPFDTALRTETISQTEHPRLGVRSVRSRGLEHNLICGRVTCDICLERLRGVLAREIFFCGKINDDVSICAACVHLRRPIAVLRAVIESVPKCIGRA